MRLLLALIAVFSFQVLGSIASAQIADDGFYLLVEAYFNQRYAFAPSEGTAAGFHQYDHKIEDLSRERIQSRVEDLIEQLVRMEVFQPKLTGFDVKIDAEILMNAIRSELLELQTLRTWESNPMAYVGIPGNAIDGLMKRDFAPKAERLKAIVARLKGVPKLHEALKANVKNPPKEFTDLAIRMARGSVGFFEDSVAAFAKDSGADAATMAEFQAADAAAIESTKAVASWLENDLLPRSKGNYAIGAENFSAKLKHDDMIDLPLKEILAKGEANLDRDYAEFVKTAKLIDPNRSPAEVMKALSGDHPSADDLIPAVRRSVEEARQFLIDRKIVTVPSEVRVKVEETPPFARNGGFASMDTPGAYEAKATEAFYYVTPVEKDWTAEHKDEHLRLFNKPVIAMINVHEAYPGHYLQFLYAPKLPTKVRKLTYCSSNVEGWAHYAEQMMVDQGFGGGDPKIRLAQLQEALLRDCRYVAGIKLHTQGWSVEKAAGLFVDRGFQEPANAYEEARRGAYNPTYLYYTYGKLQIQELRDEFLARKKGSTLRDFHDAFVSQGGVPIALMRKILFEGK